MEKKWVPFLVIALCCFVYCDASSQNLQTDILPSKLTKEESIVFVILTHVNNPSHEALYKKCYQSVRQFYPDTPVVIIDDNSKIPVSIEGLHNTVLVRSEYPGAGELLPYYYFVNCKWADKMVFLHDSMFLKRAFTAAELKGPVKFHWHFVNPGGPVDPLNVDFFLSNLSSGAELMECNHKKGWHGCFGVTSMIDLVALEQIEEKYRFTHILKDLIRTRSHREALERVFAIVVFKENLVSKESCSNFGSIHSYPYHFRNVDVDTMNQIMMTYPGAILKTWQGR